MVEASGLVRPQSGGKRSETKRYIISNYPLVQKQGSNESKQTIKKEVALFYFLFIVTQSEVAYRQNNAKQRRTKPPKHKATILRTVKSFVVLIKYALCYAP